MFSMREILVFAVGMVAGDGAHHVGGVLLPQMNRAIGLRGFSFRPFAAPIADYRFCTAGGNEDDVAGFHLCHHCLAARLGRTAAHANFFAEFASRDHNCRPALIGSISQLHQQFLPEMVGRNHLSLPHRCHTIGLRLFCISSEGN
jgi:hypothetical protein